MPRRRDIERLQGEIHELFADLWQVPRIAGAQLGFRPSADCFHSAEPPSITVVVDLSGIDPKGLHVVVHERTLVIAGERKRARTGRVSYHQMEIDYGPFQRQIRLEEDVDVEAAQATYDRGLLTVVLPVAPKPASAGRVPIAVETRP